jgi:hypothetical protein
VKLTDNLTAVCNASDIDSETLTYNYRWYKDDVLQSGLITDYIDYTNTSEGDIWLVSCQANDSLLTSAWLNSSEVIIGDTEEPSNGGGGGGSSWPETTQQEENPVKTTEDEKLPLMSLFNLDLDLDKVKGFLMDNLALIAFVIIITGLYIGNASRSKRRKIRK